MQSNQQTLQPYYGDNWYPNSAGHQLGGRLLYTEIINAYGTCPIHFIGRNNRVNQPFEGR